MFIHKAAASIQVCWHLQPDLASANHRPFCWHLLCLSQSQAVLYLVWFSACQWGSLFLYSLDSCWWTVSFTGDLICMQFWPQPITGRAVSCTIFRRPMRFSVSLQPGLVQMDGVLYRGLDLYVRYGQRFPRWPISNPPKRGVTFRKLFWNIQFTKSFMRRNSFWLPIFFNFTVNYETLLHFCNTEYCRRRTMREGKAKVVGVVWGTAFIQFLAALRTTWKNRMNYTRIIWIQGWIHPFHQNHPCTT